MDVTGGEDLDDPRCPECGGPIAADATACIHCSTDLSDRQPVAPGAVHDNSDGTDAAGRGESEPTTVSTASSRPVEHPLDPDGVMDNTLTVLIGIGGGIVVGVVGTFVLLIMIESLWALAFGLVAWLGATAYLVRRRYVMDAVAKTAYGVALVLLTVPLVALAVGGGIVERGTLVVVLLLLVVMPAGIAAGIGWFASRYVPEDARGN